MTLNEKSILKKQIECVKESNIFIGLKMTCSGVLDGGDREKDNETGLKEGGGIEMSTTVLSIRVPLFRLNTYLILKRLEIHPI